MGSRDIGHREKKKQKKDSKKPQVISTFEATRTEVEVIKKGKKPKDFEEEE